MLIRNISSRFLFCRCCIFFLFSKLIFGQSDVRKLAGFIIIIIIASFFFFFGVVLLFTHARMFLLVIIIYQWDQNMERSFKIKVAAAAREYCAKAQCYSEQSRWMVLFIFVCKTRMDSYINNIISLFKICVSDVHIVFMFHYFHGSRWTQQIGLLPIYGFS